VLDFMRSWIQYQPLVESTGNSSLRVNIGMAPYEALYGRKCGSPLHWDEVSERQLLSSELVQDTKEKIAVIRKRMLTAQSHKKVMRISIAASLNSQLVTLCTSRCHQYGLHGIFGNKGKHNPSYVGLFQVLKQVSPLAYKIEMPPSLAGIHDIFHV